MWIEEHLEGSVVLGAQLVVLVDEDLGEERLVAQPPVGVVAPGVDVGPVRLQEAVLLAFEPVAVGGEAFQFLGLVGHEPVELVVEHPREGVLLGGRDLDAGVVVLDEFLDVFDEHRLARAVGALGVLAGAVPTLSRSVSLWKISMFAMP
ncbi:hypothetical protein [Kytococcus sedentarius]|uniref:hypothetical protein n=1 Tax=Kytococcus sedentarius TaxID=1276 RepID=UPI00194E4B2B|nr:hypothetical protein [Kytococcus sedentarius]QRO88621.1 hypothetical protein I6J30_09495 [Kytococcus sedentarius]